MVTRFERRRDTGTVTCVEFGAGEEIIFKTKEAEKKKVY